MTTIEIYRTGDIVINGMRVHWSFVWPSGPYMGGDPYYIGDSFYLPVSTLLILLEEGAENNA